MTFKAMILPDGTLRLVTPVDLKKYEKQSLFGTMDQSIELSIVGMPDCYILTSVEASLTPLFLVEGFPINFDVTNSFASDNSWGTYSEP